MTTSDDNENEKRVCSITEWYKLFKAHTMKTKSILLSNEFLDYLQQDGIIVPKMDTFSELLKMDTYRQELGNYVFIKLNWSCPKDAKWINGSLKCISVEEMILLLKSSDFISHDLQARSSHPMYLSLRKWKSIRESMEFRCFVKNKQMKAISQRHCDKYFAFLHDMKESVENDIQLFFTQHIEHVFPLENYTFDIYFQENRRIIILDFNIFDPQTDPLLFTWKELATDETFGCRVVLGPEQIASGTSLHNYRVPIDFELNELYTEKGMEEFLKQTEITCNENE